MIKFFKSAGYITTCILCLLLSGCTKDDGTIVESNGLTKDINDIVPQAIIDLFEEMGMYIYSGENPPVIENIYLITPNTLFNSNLPGDSPGIKYADTKVRFYNQNNSKLTIKIEYKQGTGTSVLVDGFIVGEDPDFTVFAEVITVDSMKVIRAYSGTVDTEGIYGWTDVLYMVDNHNLPGKIANGSCRMFYDSDYLSEIISSMTYNKTSGEISILKRVEE